MLKQLRRALLALSVLFGFALAYAPEGSAAAKSDVCVSVDGNLKVQHGSATCYSTAGNKARATGSGSYAAANGGTGSTAVATDGGTAITYLADNGTATADGSGSLASVTGGSGSSATATNGGSAQVVNCEATSVESHVAGEQLFVGCP